MRATKTASKKNGKTVSCITLKEHIVEIISDSGEGAQRCGQSLGSIAARMGNGVWTTEIIPAEIRPPARSVAGASGNRIRIGADYITSGGDRTDLVVAFNEQVLLRRVRAGELKPGCIILPQAYVGADAHLGVGCIVNAGAIVDHNAHLGRGVHVAPGGIVKASAEVAEFGKVDSGEIVRSPWENQ
mgnify:CR=1 FL=1